jgi:NADP-reducing hydrogenase subunit HndB
MSRIQSMEDLETARQQAHQRQQALSEQYRFDIRVSTASCGVAAGALDTLAAFKRLAETLNLTDVRITETGCGGLCALEPLVQVQESGRPPITYGRVTPQVARRILTQHIEKGLIVPEYVIEAA